MDKSGILNNEKKTLIVRPVHGESFYVRPDNQRRSIKGVKMFYSAEEAKGEACV